MARSVSRLLPDARVPKTARGRNQERLPQACAEVSSRHGRGQGRRPRKSSRSSTRLRGAGRSRETAQLRCVRRGLGAWRAASGWQQAGARARGASTSVRATGGGEFEFGGTGFSDFFEQPSARAAGRLFAPEWLLGLWQRAAARERHRGGHHGHDRGGLPRLDAADFLPPQRREAGAATTVKIPRACATGSDSAGRPGRRGCRRRRGGRFVPAVRFQKHPTTRWRARSLSRGGGAAVDLRAWRRGGTRDVEGKAKLKVPTACRASRKFRLPGTDYPGGGKAWRSLRRAHRAGAERVTARRACALGKARGLGRRQG